jgi:hypothetical protein
MVTGCDQGHLTPSGFTLSVRICKLHNTRRQGLFKSRDFVTSGQKAPLGRIWRNFRLRMRRTYFRTGLLQVT